MDPIQVNVDLLGSKGQAYGEVAKRFATEGFNVNKRRPYIGPDGRSYITVFNGGDPTDARNYMAAPITANATLLPDEWKTIDSAVKRVAQQRLRAVNHLQSNNLVRNLNNPMGSTSMEWYDVDGEIPTGISMDGRTRQENNRPNYETNQIPLPIISADYEIPQRLLEVSRNKHESIDTHLAEKAARALAERMEDMLITDTTYSYGAGTIYSYINHPDRVPTTWQTNGNWLNGSKTPENMREDVLHMKQKSLDNNHYGPWTLYIPSGYETVLDNHYYGNNSGSSVTIRQALLGIEGINDIQVLDRLPANNMLLIEMSSEVVEWINGLDIQNIEWTSEGGMVHYYKVIAIQLPRIMSDQRGQSGIIHMS